MKVVKKYETHILCSVCIFRKAYAFRDKQKSVWAPQISTVCVGLHFRNSMFEYQQRPSEHTRRMPYSPISCNQTTLSPAST